MTLPEVLRQFSYWRKRPPPGDLIAILAKFIGWKPSQAEEGAPKMDLGPGYAQALAQHKRRAAAKKGAPPIEGKS